MRAYERRKKLSTRKDVHERAYKGILMRRASSMMVGIMGSNNHIYNSTYEAKGGWVWGHVYDDEEVIADHPAGATELPRALCFHPNCSICRIIPLYKISLCIFLCMLYRYTLTIGSLIAVHWYHDMSQCVLSGNITIEIEFVLCRNKVRCARCPPLLLLLLVLLLLLIIVLLLPADNQRWIHWLGLPLLYTAPLLTAAVKYWS